MEGLAKVMAGELFAMRTRLSCYSGSVTAVAGIVDGCAKSLALAALDYIEKNGGNGR